MHNGITPLQARKLDLFMQETYVVGPKLFSQGRNHNEFDLIHPNSSP